MNSVGIGLKGILNREKSKCKSLRRLAGAKDGVIEMKREREWEPDYAGPSRPFKGFLPLILSDLGSHGKWNSMI